MKKTAMIFLILALTLTACGNNSTPSSDDNNASAPSESNTVNDSASELTPPASNTPIEGSETPSSNGTEPELQSEFTLIRLEVEPDYCVSFYLFLDDHQIVSGYDAFDLNAKTLDFSEIAGQSPAWAIHDLLSQMLDKGYIKDESELGLLILTEDEDETAVNDFTNKLHMQIYSFADDNDMTLHTYQVDARTGDQVRFDIGMTGSSEAWPSNDILDLLPIPDRDFEIEERKVFIESLLGFEWSGYDRTSYYVTVMLNREEDWILKYTEMVKANGFTNPPPTYGTTTDIYYKANKDDEYGVEIEDGGFWVRIRIFKDVKVYD